MLKAKRADLNRAKKSRSMKKNCALFKIPANKIFLYMCANTPQMLKNDEYQENQRDDEINQ